MNERLKGMGRSAAKYKYVWLVLLFGLVLIMLPSNHDTKQAEIQAPALQTPPPASNGFDLEREEERLRETLCAIKGAGECKVLLSISATEETELAKNGENTLILSGNGSSGEHTVTLRRIYPLYEGAVIVSSGAGDPAVKYDLLNAVMIYTGLRSDQISICTMYE